MSWLLGHVEEMNHRKLCYFRNICIASSQKTRLVGNDHLCIQSAPILAKQLVDSCEKSAVCSDKMNIQRPQLDRSCWGVIRHPFSLARWWLAGGSDNTFGDSESYEPGAALFAIIAAASLSLPFFEKGTVEPDERFGRFPSIVFYVVICATLIWSMIGMISPELANEKKFSFDKGSIRFMRRILISSGLTVVVVSALAVFGQLPNQRQKFFVTPLRIDEVKIHSFKEPAENGVVVRTPFGSDTEFKTQIPRQTLLSAQLDDKLFNECAIVSCQVLKREDPPPSDGKPPKYNLLPRISLPANAGKNSDERKYSVEAPSIEATGDYQVKWYIMRRASDSMTAEMIKDYIEKHKDSAVRVALISREE